MSADFEKAMEYLIADERFVYTNNPLDSGGPTKCGVTLKSYSLFLQRPVTPEEIENLTMGEVKAFYLGTYWKPLHCEEIRSAAAATALFDSAILYGIGTASRIAQEAMIALGAAIPADGVFGSGSVSALNSIPDASFIGAFREKLLKRIDFVVRTNFKNQAFRQGWINRANRLLTLSTEYPLNKEVT